MPYPPKSFDDLQPGMTFTAGPRRISRSDIAAFATLSGDHTLLHTDDAHAATTPFGSVVSHGALNLAVATGLAFDTGIFTGTVLAVRSMVVSFDRPVFPGDDLSLELVVTELDPKVRIDRGQVVFAVVLKNQHGRAVITGSWKVLLRRSPAT